MSWRDTIKPIETDEKPKSWRDTITELPDTPKMTEMESATRGAFDAASLGWLDELAGGLEAVGSKVGVRGLGGSFSDIRLETDEEDKQSFDEVYRQARDAKRELSRSAEEQNPKSYMAGQLAGGIATGAAGAGALGVKAGAGLGTRVAAGMAGGALDGAITGAGMSEANNVKGVLKDAAQGGAIGGAFGGVVPAVGAAVRKATPAFNKAVFDLDDDISRKLIEEPDYLKGVKSIDQIEGEAVDAANNLGTALRQWDDEAWDTLNAKPMSPEAQVPLKKRLTQLIKDELTSQGHIRIGVDGKPFAVPTPQSTRAIKRADELVDLVQKSNLSPQEMKRIVRSIDSEINWDKQELEATNKFLRTIRHTVDEELKSANPEYRKVMTDLADGVRLQEDVRKGLRLKKEIGGDSDSGLVQTDTTRRKLETALRGQRRDTDNGLRDSLDRLSDYRRQLDGPSFTEDLEKLDISRRATGGVTNGSRGINLGMGAAGGTLGAIFGPIGGGAGVAVGAAAGALRDKFGRTMGTKTAQLVGQMRNNYGRFFTGVGTGSNKAAINHWLLYQKDQQYKDLYDQIQKEMEQEGEQ